MGEKLQDSDAGKYFLSRIPVVQKIKPKIDK
jgi:hypothetical protein